MTKPQETSVDRLLELARGQSVALAETRVRQVPSRWRPQRTARAAWYASALSAATLACLVLVGAGVTWAVIGDRAVVTPRQVPTLGEALEQEGRVIGPPPLAQTARPADKTNTNRGANRRPVVEKAPRIRRPLAASAARRPVNVQATTATKPTVASKPTERQGTVVFDQPAGDVIIVSPKSKQGPLWTPKDFGKYMRMRRRMLSY